MVQAMLLGALRRSEVLELSLEDGPVGERRLFIAEGKGGHRRIVPISGKFLRESRRLPGSRTPRDQHDQNVRGVLEGPRRGHDAVQAQA